MNKNLLIFDLFGTILLDISNDHSKGFTYLAKEANKPLDKIKDVARMFHSKYMNNRTITLQETSMIAQLNFFQEILGFTFSKSLFTIEYEFLLETRINHINTGMLELLDFLLNRNYELYIMSNTIFSASSLKQYLDGFGINSYFTDVFTSSDFGYRKPSEKFFFEVWEKISKNEYIQPNKVIFIGDKIEKDILGAKEFGYKPVLLSDKNTELAIAINCLKFNSLFQFKSYLESHYIYLNSIADNLSASDGPGNRLVVYLQGCEIKCPGCHNQNTWDIQLGKRYEVEHLALEIISKTNKYARNITISGGEPLYQEHATINLINILSKADINICLYTSYDFDLVPSSIKDRIQYLKTGSYINSLIDTTNGYFGSSNQQFWKKNKEGAWEILPLK